MNIKKLSRTVLEKKYRALYEWARGMDRIIAHDAVEDALNKIVEESYFGKISPDQILGAMRFFNYFKKSVYKHDTEYRQKLEKVFNEDMERWRMLDMSWYAPIEIPEEEEEV